jgi:uncharacterized protein (TIGR02996 family)
MSVSLTSPATTDPQAQSFLEDIRANPDDDTPRLVYADWLMERDNPRGELIRVQCDLAKIDDEDPRRPVLQAREQELLDAHEAGWRAELPSFKPIRWGPFERGFIARAQAQDTRYFLRYAEQMFAATPLTGLKIRGLSSPEPLIESGYLLRLRHLDLSGRALLVWGTSLVAHSPQVANLTTLLLRRCRVGIGGCAAIAHSPRLAKLTHLDLGENSLSARKLRKLVTSPVWAGLHTLNLSNNYFLDEDLMVLTGAPALASLRRLILGPTRLGPAGVEALVASPYLANLQQLVMEPRVLHTSSGATDYYGITEEERYRLRDHFGDRWREKEEERFSSREYRR